MRIRAYVPARRRQVAGVVAPEISSQDHGCPAVPGKDSFPMSQRRRPPVSPEAAAIIRAQLAAGRRRSLTRRSMLGGAAALGAGAALAACGTGGTSGSGSSKPAPAKDISKTDKIVNWGNWPLYLDFDEKKKVYPTLEEFQKL